MSVAIMDEWLTRMIGLPEFNAAPLRHAAVFMAIAHGNEPSVRELSRRFRIPPPAVVRAVDTLVSQELVERTPSHTDGRVVYFRLTGRGKELLKEIL